MPCDHSNVDVADLVVVAAVGPPLPFDHGNVADLVAGPLPQSPAATAGRQQTGTDTDTGGDEDEYDAVEERGAAAGTVVLMGGAAATVVAVAMAGPS